MSTPNSESQEPPSKKAKAKAKAKARNELPGSENGPSPLVAVSTSKEHFIATAQAIAPFKLSKLKLSAIYDEYSHTVVNRVWSADEIRQVTEMLKKLGFSVSLPVELNDLLPEGSRLKNGQHVPEANVFFWPGAAEALGIDLKQLEKQLDALELDTHKWSRRAPKTNGLQNKVKFQIACVSPSVNNARWNCCFTDLKDVIRAKSPDEGDISERRVKHKHPKNPSIKFSNYAFRAVPELDRFKEIFPKILGPFGYKFRGQFAELNKYYDTAKTGIGRHGDVERGHPGAVNCLKVGPKIPLLFSWYRDTKPVGKGSADDVPESSHEGISYPIVSLKKPQWDAPTKTAAAVIQAGEGAVYMMSGAAIGQNWRQRDLALRHCAGASKYTGLPKEGPFAVPRGKKAYSLTFSDRVENDSESPELQFSTEWEEYA